MKFITSPTETPPPSHPLHVLVADDEDDTRVMLDETLRFLGHQPYLAQDGDHALDIARAHTLDAAFVDVVMPGLSGLALVWELRAIQPWLYAILMTAYGDTQAGYTARAAPVCDYADKPLTPARLASWLDKVTAHLAGMPPGLHNLTPREQAILRQLAQGRSDAAIAQALALSPRTVSNYVRRILAQLGVHNRTEAAVLWVRYSG